MSTKSGGKAPLNSETLQNILHEHLENDHLTAFRLIDSNNTDLREMSSEMTELAQKLAEWISDENN